MDVPSALRTATVDTDASITNVCVMQGGRDLPVTSVEIFGCFFVFFWLGFFVSFCLFLYFRFFLLFIFVCFPFRYFCF